MTELHPDTDYGEVELRVDYVLGREELDGRYPLLDPDGVPAKAYRTQIDYFRASRDIAGKMGSDPDLQGKTLIIKRRRGNERETPPGYSGSGNVVVSLYPGFRYWRFEAGAGLEVHSGRVLCTPDEAVQLVATRSAIYA